MANDINTLFSSLGNTNNNSVSSDLLGISYTDYASIRNGSYGKLLNSYYQKELDNSGSSGVGTTDSKQMLTSINSAASDLKDSAAKLLSKGKDSLFTTKKDEKGNSYVDYDTDKVYKAVKDFVDNYNSLLDAAADTDTTSILRSAVSLVSYTEANKNALAEVGITVGTDNKLSIDKDKFEEASKARVQSLFQSTGGYAYQINSKAGMISNHASLAAEKASDESTKSSSSSAITSTSTSKDSTKTLAAIREAASDAQDKLSALRTLGSKNLFTQTNGKYDVDAISDAVKNFVKDYNTLLEKTEDSNTSDIRQARRTMMNYIEAKESTLSSVGITIDSDGSLSVDSEKFKAADMSKVKSLFQGSGSMGAQLEAQISKIDTYAEIQSSKSNTYSGSGNYNSTYASGDLYNSMI